MRLRECAGVTLVTLLSAVAAAAQGPWTLTVAPNRDPIAIGTCVTVIVKAFDPVVKGTPRTEAGHYVSAADYDFKVESSDKAAVVGKYESSSIWSACVCQGATIGSQGTITVTYPAQALPEKLRVPGVAMQAKASFSFAKGGGSTYNPPGCDALKAPAAATARAAGPTPSGVRTPIPASAPTAGAAGGSAASGSAASGSPSSGTSAAGAMPVAPPQTLAAGPRPVAAPVTIAPSAPPAPISILPPMGTGTIGASATGPIFSSTAKMTNFKPSINGFMFANTFTNNFLGPPINMETSGLCGGMTYAVLDYYYRGMRVPNQSYRPANATTMQKYLYERQVTSLLQNGDRWIELSVNPFGTRTLEFFNWGIGPQLAILRSFIDRGVPIPLGLKGAEGGTLSADHQVLAIGYDVGRYASDLGQYKQDVKLYIVDPNYPNRIMTLVPDVTTLQYRYAETDRDHWRTYFVNGQYFPITPPALPNATYPNDSLIYELLLEFDTGADDMRGYLDHVDLKVTQTDNTTQYFPNISQGGRWLPNYSETARVVLMRPVAPADIKSVEISTNAQGGIDGDDWDMTSVTITGVGGGFSRKLRIDRNGPYRFRNGAAVYSVNVRCCFW